MAPTLGSGISCRVLACVALAGATLSGCSSDFAHPERAFADAGVERAQHPVTITTPAGLGAIETTASDVNGAPLQVGCATCHGPDRASALAHREGPVTDVHGALELRHGDLTCDACHDPADRRGLRLADGRKLPMRDAMRLCAQCHGVQVRDYRRGSHGGMRGYWDLRQGPRTRNHCLQCHQAHAPQFGRFRPVLPPRDRYFSTGGH